MSNPPAVPTPDLPLVRLLESEKFMFELRKVASAQIKPERLARLFVSAAKTKFDITTCTTASVLAVAMKCAQLGIEPDGRHAHLIPYKNRETGAKELTLQIDYKGYIMLGRRHGVKDIYSDLVGGNDLFDYYRDETGLHFKHKPNLHERGEIVGAYCFFKIDDEPDLEYMTVEQIEDIRAKSPKADGEIWTQNWGEMAKKTTVRRAQKRWPLDPEVAEAIVGPTETTVDSGSPAQPKEYVEPATAALFQRKQEQLPPAQNEPPSWVKAAQTAESNPPQYVPDDAKERAPEPAQQPAKPRGRPARAATPPAPAAAPTPDRTPAPTYPYNPEPTPQPAPTVKPVTPTAPTPPPPSPARTQQKAVGGGAIPLPEHLVALDQALTQRNITRTALLHAMIDERMIDEGTPFDALREDVVIQITPGHLDALAESLREGDVPTP